MQREFWSNWFASGNVNVACHADVLRDSSRVPSPGLHHTHSKIRLENNEPKATSAWETIVNLLEIFFCTIPYSFLPYNSSDEIILEGTQEDYSPSSRIKHYFEKRTIIPSAFDRVNRLMILKWLLWELKKPPQVWSLTCAVFAIALKSIKASTDIGSFRIST